MQCYLHNRIIKTLKIAPVLREIIVAIMKYKTKRNPKSIVHLGKTAQYI